MSDIYIRQISIDDRLFKQISMKNLQLCEFGNCKFCLAVFNDKAFSINLKYNNFMMANYTFNEEQIFNELCDDCLSFVCVGGNKIKLIVDNVFEKNEILIRWIYDVT